MSSSLESIVNAAALPGEDVQRRTRFIHEEVRRRSAFLDAPNFTAFHPSDLRTLFQLYDQQFLDGACGRAIPDKAISFRISRRMTSAAGTTTRHGRIRAQKLPRFTISVSAPLLYQNMHATDRSVRIGGLICRDRLEALQRVFEHEIVHLLEMVLWDDSSCHQPRFRQIARGMFGHTEHVHRLITPRERAYRELGVHVGSVVSFEIQGERYTGVVNRIMKRATVLVEDPRGILYSDGKYYAKYYVPLSCLKREKLPA